MKFKILLALVLVVIGVANARTIVDVLLQIGNGTDVDVEIEAELGKGVNNPALKYNATDDAWEFCNEGAACQQMGSDSGLPLLSKGSLVTNDGTNNSEFTACADTEIIEWDSAETNGFKCVAKPVDTNTNAATLCAAGEYLDGDGTCKTLPSGGGGGATPTVVTGFTEDYVSAGSDTTRAVSFSVTSGATVKVDCIITASFNYDKNSDGNCADDNWILQHRIDARNFGSDSLIKFGGTTSLELLDQDRFQQYGARSSGFPSDCEASYRNTSHASFYVQDANNNGTVSFDIFYDHFANFSGNSNGSNDSTPVETELRCDVIEFQ